MNSLHERLCAARAYLQLKQSEFAEQIGVSERAYQGYEAGRSVPGGNALEGIGRVGIDVNWLLTGEGVMLLNQRVEQPMAEYNGFVAIPIYKEVEASAGPGALPPDLPSAQVLKFSEDWIRHDLRAAPSDLYLINVDGDSMEPTLRSGDVILVDHRVTRPTREGVYILRMDGALLVKRLQFRPGEMVDVISDNKEYSSFSVKLSEMAGLDFAVLGRVVWSGRRV